MGKRIKPAMTIDRFTDLAGAIVDEIPEKYCRDLNGGFNIVESAKADGEYFIMGEYIQDEILGSTIMIYYGSFVKLLGSAGMDTWEKELRETILHELRHHVEIMAGVDYLTEEEMAELVREKSKRG
jgi:hypothetical protein